MSWQIISYLIYMYFLISWRYNILSIIRMRVIHIYLANSSYIEFFEILNSLYISNLRFLEYPLVKSLILLLCPNHRDLSVVENLHVLFLQLIFRRGAGRWILIYLIQLWMNDCKYPCARDFPFLVPGWFWEYPHSWRNWRQEKVYNNYSFLIVCKRT